MLLTHLGYGYQHLRVFQLKETIYISDKTHSIKAFSEIFWKYMPTSLFNILCCFWGFLELSRKSNCHGHDSTQGVGAWSGERSQCSGAWIFFFLNFKLG